MEQVQGRTFRVYVAIIFDWKMVAVLECAYLIRQLFK